MFALAPGFFLPLEQELGRALAHRRAIGQGGRPTVAKVGRLSLVLLAIVVLAILALSPLIANDYFDGEWVMLFALIAGFSAYAPVHLSRGICSGSGRFREYAIIMGSDGVVRIVLCVLLAIVGVTAVGAYGFAVALAPLVGLTWVYTHRGLRTDPGPDASWAEVTPNLGWLLLGSVFASSLLNAGPIAMTLLTQTRRREGTGHTVRLRRAPGAHPAVHVPGGAGGAPPAVVPSGRHRRPRRVPQRAQAVADDGPRGRRRRHGRCAPARPVRARGGVRRRRHHRPDAGGAGARQRLLHGRRSRSPRP